MLCLFNTPPCIQPYDSPRGRSSLRKSRPLICLFYLLICVLLCGEPQVAVADPGALGGLTPPPPSEVFFACLSVYENSGPEHPPPPRRIPRSAPGWCQSPRNWTSHITSGLDRMMVHSKNLLVVLINNNNMPIFYENGYARLVSGNVECI